MGVEVKRLIGLITQLGPGATINLGALPAMVEDLPNPKDWLYVLQFFTFDTDSFHKQELQIYLEYGLQDYLNLILKSPYTWSEDNGDNKQGFSDQKDCAL